MASTCDDFLINFDLNQFGIEETAQPNYEKVRKTTHLLKKKIISTDFVVQRYLAKTEDYNQALKAHSLTKEDLKQVCINYKNTSERCMQLEQDIKQSQANQEALERRATEAETKYDALLSYSNQMQALVQQLKSENEALVIEKKLDFNSTKVLQLQKEKEALHKNILALKDVISQTRKKGKHLKKLKAISKESKIITSDESADECCSQLSYSRRKSYKINDLAVKDSNLEPDFIDNDSDTCNEELSTDTGCGSSRANSDKNDMNSPEHYTFEASLKFTDNNLVKHVEVATSPITVRESISVSTSPVLFDTPLLEHLNKEFVDHSNDTCTIYAIIEENKDMVDSCTSPIPILPEFNKHVDVGTSPIKKLNSIQETFNEDVKKPITKSLFSDLDEDSETKQMEVVSEDLLCLCKNFSVMKTRTNLIDVCTSPISELSSLCYSEINSSDKTPNHRNSKECYNLLRRKSLNNCENSGEIYELTKICCDKFTSTENIIDTEMCVVDASTSPILMSIDNSQTVNNDVSTVCLSDCRQDIHKEYLCQEGFNLESSVTQKESDKKANENKTISQICSKEAFNIQEKSCLENNNSINVSYDAQDDDIEIQNILRMMTFPRNLISPLPDSPINLPITSEYLNMHIRNIYELIENCNNNIKIVHNNVEEIKKRDAANFPNSEDEVEGIESNSEKEQQGIITNTPLKRVQAEEEEKEEEYISDIIVLSNTANCNISDNCRDISVLEGSSYSTPDMPTDNSKIQVASDNNIRISEIKEPGICKVSSSTHTKHTPPRINVESSEDFETEIVNLSPENNSNRNNVTEPKISCLNAKKSTPKSKPKSKLQKLRDKMLPSRKIKKMASPTNVSKNRKIRPRESISPSVKQRIAYEKAVRVMNELKSKEASEKQTKTNLSPNIGIEIDVPEIESSPFYNKVIYTRSRTSKLNEKENDANLIVSPKRLTRLEKDTSDVQISPLKRKTRKRPAENIIEDLKSNRKRSLRSRNDTIILSTVQIEIEPTDNDIELKACNENVSCSREQEEILTIGPQEIKFDINNIDQSKDEQDKRLMLNYIESLEATYVPNLMIDKKHKSVENDQILKKPYVNDPLIAPPNIDEEENIRQKKECSLINTSMEISESFNDNNVNISVQVEDSCFIHSTENSNLETVQESQKDKTVNITLKKSVKELTPLGNVVVDDCDNRIVSYSDLSMYSMDPSTEETVQNVPPKENLYLKENILCVALEKYGVNKVKLNAKKIPETITNSICQKIEQFIADTIASPKDQQKNKMNQLIHSIQGFKMKQILAGLMKYLKDPTRKCELFNTINNGSAPPMTRSEVILLYVIEHLSVFLISGNFVQSIYANIEHALFQLNHAPSFETIESLSHFYAVMCRYFRNKSRLRCFMLDAMYCLQFKAVPLIKQCLDICPGVLPYAHEHMAKTSLVTCLVYLLHFYKCTDKYNRVQEIRNILCRKYQYRFSEWNETMILEIFRKAIMNLNDMNSDKKMLRLALIILCKRHGANWCQTKIVQNMLLPIIQQPVVPEKIKQFCVLMLGPLVKPFPADKKAQCEIIINQLLQLLKNNPSHEMQEAVYSSLIFMSKHDQEQVVHALLSWNPKKVSNDFEEILNDYVMDRPLSLWKKLISKPSQCNS